MASIDTITHPKYDEETDDWKKFRLTFEGGEAFKREYLKKFSIRETHIDFSARLAMCHVPAHAKAAVCDIKNSIFQRLVDVERLKGPPSYQDVITGSNRGVDLQGNSMTGFVGRRILPELLSMRKVGVFVDKPIIPEGASRAITKNVRPYIYVYQAEDIRSWTDDTFGNLQVVLLRDRTDEIDENGLVVNQLEEYRLLTLTESGVQVQFFNTQGEEIIEKGILLNLPEIPLVRFELSASLLKDIADYQIALLNMGSSDVNYSLKSNFPFYTEQFSPAAEMAAIKSPDQTGEKLESNTSGGKTVNVGVTQGRMYPKGLDRPDFIHPSSEPMNASMSKQAELREEIRQLVNLALTNIEPRRASAESKAIDMQSLEAGLSYIGLELEYGEREIGRIWAAYEGRSEQPTITYPRSYSLRSDEDRLTEAGQLRKLLDATPSIEYQKVLAKDIIKITVGHKVDEEELKSMHAEVDKSKIVQTDSKTIISDMEAGLVTAKTASELRGYPDGEAEKAAKETDERMALRAESQAQARGLGGEDPNASKNEKNDTPKRGEQKTRTESE